VTSRDRAPAAVYPASGRKNSLARASRRSGITLVDAARAESLAGDSRDSRSIHRFEAATRAESRKFFSQAGLLAKSRNRGVVAREFFRLARAPNDFSGDISLSGNACKTGTSFVSEKIMRRASPQRASRRASRVVDEAGGTTDSGPIALYTLR